MPKPLEIDSPASSLDVFISWSGPAGRKVAEALQGYLGDVLHPVEFWVSSVDIRSGTVWMNEIGEKLNAVGSGIVVVTPDALRSPWLYFEAGALAKASLNGQREDSALHPYLFDVPNEALTGTPLQGFFAAGSTQKGTLDLATSIHDR